jgi:hypothetical protein
MSRSDDDRVLREMLTPDLDEALDALGFWIRRRATLPFTRRSSRREADRMIAFWQSRAISAMVRSPVALALSLGRVVEVGRLAASHHARRAFGRMTRVVVAVAAVAGLMLLVAR